MANVILIIITIIVMYLSIKIIIKSYKKANDSFEKTLYTIFSITILFPLILYYLDRFNIPTLLRYTKNIDSKQWLDIISNYISSFISTIVSAFFLVFVTIRQIERTYRDNEKLNKENQRLQNLPLLSYTISQETLDENIFNENTVMIFSKRKSKSDKNINLLIKIKNIGMNSIRKLFFVIESDFFELKKVNLSNQGCIEKGGEKQKGIIIIGADEGNYKICITVYYQDLLSNWYKQIIDLEITVMNQFCADTKDYALINKIMINDEKIIEKITSKHSKI